MAFTDAPHTYAHRYTRTTEIHGAPQLLPYTRFHSPPPLDSSVYIKSTIAGRMNESHSFPRWFSKKKKKKKYLFSKKEKARSKENESRNCRKKKKKEDKKLVLRSMWHSRLVSGSTINRFNFTYFSICYACGLWNSPEAAVEIPNQRTVTNDFCDCTKKCSHINVTIYRVRRWRKKLTDLPGAIYSSRNSHFVNAKSSKWLNW